LCCAASKTVFYRLPRSQCERAKSEAGSACDCRCGCVVMWSLFVLLWVMTAPLVLVGLAALPIVLLADGCVISLWVATGCCCRNEDCEPRGCAAESRHRYGGNIDPWEPCTCDCDLDDQYRRIPKPVAHPAGPPSDMQMEPLPQTAKHTHCPRCAQPYTDDGVCLPCQASIAGSNVAPTPIAAAAAAAAAAADAPGVGGVGGSPEYVTITVQSLEKEDKKAEPQPPHTGHDALMHAINARRK